MFAVFCRVHGYAATRDLADGGTLIGGCLGALMSARMGAVQHESTATHTDGGGRGGTREDGDLRGWTCVDVLPPDGMQEVSGSSPLSSTRSRRSGPGFQALWNPVKIV